MCDYKTTVLSIPRKMNKQLSTVFQTKINFRNSSQRHYYGGTFEIDLTKSLYGGKDLFKTTFWFVCMCSASATLFPLSFLFFCLTEIVPILYISPSLIICTCFYLAEQPLMLQYTSLNVPCQHNSSSKNMLIHELKRDLGGQNLVCITDWNYLFTNEVTFYIAALKKAEVWDISKCSLVMAINHLLLLTVPGFPTRISH